MIKNTLLNSLKEETNFTYTENGAVTHKTTGSAVLDMFANGGAMRARGEEDIILMFRKAFAENPKYAMKCLFYLRDCRGGQGERRFFRIIMKDMAEQNAFAAKRNLQYIPLFGRWDDLYVFVNTPLESAMFNFMKEQLALDIESKTPSLLAKWMKSENTSSAESRYLGMKTRKALGMTSKQYRKTLSHLRTKINVLEKLMSENKWDEIYFDRIPSRAGMIYKNAFARHDIERVKADKQTYADFAKDKIKTVNASVLYPQEIAHKAFYETYREPMGSTNRLMLQKYWDALPDYYQGRQENGIAVVDVSGSMSGVPIEAAVSLGAYVAEKAHGPFANHFITFSGKPDLVEFEGVDISDKFNRCKSADWEMNTNIEAVFDLLLNTALKNKTPQEDMPERLYIFSDMEFDKGLTTNNIVGRNYWGEPIYEKLNSDSAVETLMESIRSKWKNYGYELPSLVFWNLRASKTNIPAIGKGFSYVSGFSPSMIETIMSGKDGYDLMLAKLDTDRYSMIH